MIAVIPFVLGGAAQAQIMEEVPTEVRTVAADAADAVVLIDAYVEVPVQMVRYELVDGSLYAFDEGVEMMRAMASFGSGFFVTDDGYLVTNNHVVSEEGATYAVNTGEEEFPAEVVYTDPARDIAILKVDGTGFPILHLDDAEEPALGALVVAMGHSLSRSGDTASWGEIASLDEEIVVNEIIERDGWLVEESETIGELIETSAKMRPGDSGGPLLGMDGEVIGVNVATALGEQVGYALPVAFVLSALQAAGVAL